MEILNKKPTPLKLEGNLAENFQKFKRSFEDYSMLIGVLPHKTEQKTALFLDCIGKVGVAIFKKLDICKEYRRKYNKVVDEFEQVLNGSKKNVSVRRILFYSREQGKGESAEHFLNDVLTLIETCEFNELCLDDILRIKIIHGIRDKDLKEKLMKEDMEDLDVIKDICRKHSNLETINETGDLPSVTMTSNTKQNDEQKSIAPKLGKLPVLGFIKKNDASVMLAALENIEPDERSPSPEVVTFKDDPAHENQWSPSNPTGEKIYNRSFLLSLRDTEASKQKPAFLEHLQSIDKGGMFSSRYSPIIK